MKIVKIENLHPQLRVPWTSKEDVFEHFSPEEDAYNEIAKDYEAANPVSAMLKHIPHFKLDIPEFDHARAWAEVQEIPMDTYSRANLRNYEETTAKGKVEHPHWYSNTMVNYTPRSSDCQGKQSKEEAAVAYPEYQENAAKILGKVPRLNSVDMNFYETETYAKLPYITNFIKEHIADDTFRMHIWKIKGEGYLNWHNHIKLPWHSDVIINDKAIVHIPLYTHPDVEMLVNKEGTIYSEHYEVGSSWIFNYIYDHAVDNPSDVFRCHIVFYVSLSNKKFADLCLKSSNKQ